MVSPVQSDFSEWPNCLCHASAPSPAGLTVLHVLPQLIADVTWKFCCRPVFLTCVLHPLLLFQALQDEVENYRGQVYDAQRRLQRNELKAQEQVLLLLSHHLSKEV